MLDIDNQTPKNISEKYLSQVSELILKQEEIKNNPVINLILVDGQTIQVLNKKYRGSDKRTDVLSFPLEIPGVPILGDIIIDIDMAEEQKGENSLIEEIQYLLLHGILHLLGYDHLNKKENEIMKKKESKYWNKIKESLI